MGLLGATTAAAVGPILVYLWPPRLPGVTKARIPVGLQRAISSLRDGEAVQFNAPKGMGFVMADGGGVNSAGSVTFGGFLTRSGGRLRALAITCPHLGCSYGFDTTKGHFLCPCHGSQFALDGQVLHGPATAPLSHLTWRQGRAADEIEIDAITVP